MPGVPERSCVRATFSLRKRSDGIAVVVFEDPAQPDGLPAAALGDALAAALDELLRWAPLAGLVLGLRGAGASVAGVDPAGRHELRSAGEGAALARRRQALGARIASLPVPGVAAVHGPCRGLGLELALAADARVASGDESTRFALPEVRLGLMPSGGGTQRLPRLVGVTAALDLLLSGPRGLRRRRARARSRRLSPLRTGCTRMPPRSPGACPGHRGHGGAPRPFPGASGSATFSSPAIRPGVRCSSAGSTGAPSRGRGATTRRRSVCWGVVRGGLARGFEAGLTLEAAAFGELAVSAESRALAALHAARRALATDPEGEGEPAGARPVGAVGVLGAGPTGAGIAYVSARHAGVEVRLAGRDAAARERGLARLRAVLDGQVRRRRLSRARRDDVLHRVRAVAGGEPLRGVDLVIDTELGPIERKHRTMAAIEGLGDGRVIYASSLSPLPIARLASSSPHPENVLGMRYGSPVERMPLLEVVAGEQSAPWAVAACVAFGRRQGKTVIVVRDGPAFYCARILAPYLNEALWLLSEGVAVEAVDWALVDFGFPSGPFVRLDDIGIDVAAEVGRILHDAFGERMHPPPAMARLIGDGRLGRRNGRGFYNYEVRGREYRGAVDGSVYTTVQAWPGVARPAAELVQRCTLLMVNEAARCLEEGIVRSARDADVGAVFGLGFPAFLGGPFRYVDALGAACVVDRLEAWAAACGERFSPAPLLAEMARSARRFYPGRS